MRGKGRRDAGNEGEEATWMSEAYGLEEALSETIYPLRVHSLTDRTTRR